MSQRDFSQACERTLRMSFLRRLFQPCFAAIFRHALIRYDLNFNVRFEKQQIFKCSRFLSIEKVADRSPKRNVKTLHNNCCSTIYLRGYRGFLFDKPVFVKREPE
jgi:hypothetical protein